VWIKPVGSVTTHYTGSVSTNNKHTIQLDLRNGETPFPYDASAGKVYTYTGSVTIWSSDNTSYNNLSIPMTLEATDDAEHTVTLSKTLTGVTFDSGTNNTHTIDFSFSKTDKNISIG